MVLMSVSLACMSRSMGQTARHQTQGKGGEGGEEMGGVSSILCTVVQLCMCRWQFDGFIPPIGESISPTWIVSTSSDHVTCGH